MDIHPPEDKGFWRLSTSPKGYYIKNLVWGFSSGCHSISVWCLKNTWCKAKFNDLSWSLEVQRQSCLVAHECPHNISPILSFDTTSIELKLIVDRYAKPPFIVYIPFSFLSPSTTEAGQVGLLTLSCVPLFHPSNQSQRTHFHMKKLKWGRIVKRGVVGVSKQGLAVII